MWKDPCGYIGNIREHLELKRNFSDINILRNQVRIMWNASEILRVSAFALVHFHSNDFIFFYQEKMKFPCLLILKNGRYSEMPCKTCCPDIILEG